MKTGAAETGAAAPIVQLVDLDDQGSQALARARAFAEPMLVGHVLDTGEDSLGHAAGVADILADIGAAPAMQAAAWLVYAGDGLQRPEDVVRKAFGESYASLVSHTRRLVQIQRAAREWSPRPRRAAAAPQGGAPAASERPGGAGAPKVAADAAAQQTERVRKMLLAFSRDLRVVLLRLASRLQTLRWHAQVKQPCPEALALETQQVFAPLANRLGIWQIKWELEDLSFRFLRPDDYHRIARELNEKRTEREAGVQQFRDLMAETLSAAGITAEVHGRPKHIYSIWKKMQGKELGFHALNDLRALRVIVADVAQCYAALARVHERWVPMPEEFDDYIARPKPNGYQSLHTVVRDDAHQPVEVQIRTRSMHEHAEFGVAAHWAYKEAGARGYAGVSAAGEFEERIADARRAVLRQLLAWERDFAGQGGAGFDDRIYVFTPQAAVIELAVGATPIDFAYALHSDLGHRCRGGKVDGQMVPLNTPLQSGQTVEVVTIKEGGPSLDWLNPELGYLASPRARAKVRAWFNNLAQAQTIARGRESVERLLQREGRTALKLDDLAARLGFRNADALFEVVGKDEFSLRNIEQLLRPAAPPPPAADTVALRPSKLDEGGGKGGVLVVGVDSLLTTLARCCRPAPPDAIEGFVTRGKGVAIHRADCSNFLHMRQRSGERVIGVDWGKPRADKPGLYALNVQVEASDRPGLLRDISEVFAKEKVNVTGVHTQSVKDTRGGTAWMTFTVEVSDATRLGQVLVQVARVGGVRQARRK